MPTNLCRGFREKYILEFLKASKSFPVLLSGTYTNEDARLIIDMGAGTYIYFEPVDADPPTIPYTYYESGTIVDNGDGTITMTPGIVYGGNSGVSGYAATVDALPSPTTVYSDLIYQVGLMPNAEWYQCICDGIICSWVNVPNPIGEEIDSLLDLPDEPCSGSKIYWGRFGAAGEIIYYGCIDSGWRDIVNPNDTLSTFGVALVGLPMTLPFGLTQTGYPDPRNTITAFDLLASNNSELDFDVVGVINNDTNTIKLIVPYGTIITSLTPTILISGAKIEPTSLVTQNFTNEYFYTCTSTGGTERKYTITVVGDLSTDQINDGTGGSFTGGSGIGGLTTVSSMSLTIINEFWFTDTANSVLSSDFYGSIDGTDINIDVPYGTTITSLIPNFTFSGASVTISSVEQISGITVKNYSSSVIYTVTAFDDTTLDYTVNVFVSTSQIEKALLSFEFEYKYNTLFSETYTGVVDETAHTIAISIPNRVNLSALYPTIRFTGVSIDSKSRLASDFSTSDTATFTVTAYDSSTQEYIATITVEDDPNQGLDITFNPTDTDITDATGELDSDLGESGWASPISFNAGLPEWFREMTDNVATHLKTVRQFLMITKSMLNIAKVFLTVLGNPIQEALRFFVNQLIILVKGIKNSGLYYCQIIPNSKLFSDLFINQNSLNPAYRDGDLDLKLSELSTEERKAYDELVATGRSLKHTNLKEELKPANNPTDLTAPESPVTEFEGEEDNLSKTEESILEVLSSDASRNTVREAYSMKQNLQSGFWLLSGSGALEIYANSFKSISDINQPLYNPPMAIKNYNYYHGGPKSYKSAPNLLSKDSTLAGGLILWFGITGGSSINKGVIGFVEILRVLIYFFSNPELEKLQKELQVIVNKSGNSWKPERVYYIKDVVLPLSEQSVSRPNPESTGAPVITTIVEKHKYTCIKVGPNGYGTSGGSEPTWPTTASATVVDGNLEWRESTEVDFLIKATDPLWMRYKLFQDMWPQGFELLNDLESVLVGFRDKIPTGNEFQGIIDYLETKVNEINKIVKLIDAFLLFVDSLSLLNGIKMSGYMVPVQNGGITKLIKGALDESDPKKPGKDDWTMSLLSFVGTGMSIPGYLFLVNILFATGSPPEFSEAVAQATTEGAALALQQSTNPFADAKEMIGKFKDVEGNVKTAYEQALEDGEEIIDNPSIPSE